MEYTNIIAAVPQGEHFDASAVNEGVWMSEAHLGSIETVLAGNATALQTAADTINTMQESNSTLANDLAAANNTIAGRDATIAAQAAEIATLKAAPAANITNTSKEKDDLGDGKVVEESEVTKEARKLREMRDGIKK